MNSISNPGENVNENSIQRSSRDTSYRTNRQILAEALTSLAANESERQMLEGYKDAAARLDANEQRIAAINQNRRYENW